MVQNKIFYCQVQDLKHMMKSVVEYNWDLWTKNEEVIIYILESILTTLRMEKNWFKNKGNEGWSQDRWQLTGVDGDSS